MKKKVSIGLGIFIVIAILGVGYLTLNASSENTIQSTEEISQLIQSQYPGEITALHLKEDSYYEAVVKNEGNVYKMTLDGKTGEILHLEQEINLDNKEELVKNEADSVEEDKSNDNNTNNSDPNQKDNENKNTDSVGNKSNNENASNNAIISTNKAKQIALEQFAGTVEEIELDEDDGRRIYEIKIINEEDEAEIEIDAYTGEIIVIDIDIDIEDDDD